MDFDNQLSKLYPWILRMAKKFCYNQQDAEDLAGETVYKMLLNRARFDFSKPIKPWCLAVMQNTYITQYNRKALIRFVGYMDAGVLKQHSSCCSSSLTLAHEILSVIHQCSLKSRCIESVVYSAKGYSYDEISEILQIPVGTVRSRIASARTMLSRELGL